MTRSNPPASGKSAGRRRLLGAAAAAGAARAAPWALAAIAAPGRAQSFPDRPVQVIVPFPGGNTLDQSLRQVGKLFAEETGQQLVIVNKPGASGIIAAQAGASAAPDGYTLTLGTTSMLTINPHTRTRLPYDPVASFAPITNYLGATMVFAANDSVPARTLPEWIAHAKANPGKTNFASFLPGGAPHFAGVLLNARAGIDMTHVPYAGTPPAVTNLIGGHVQTAILPLLAVKKHVEAGKVKVFAVTSARRSPLLPDVPTFAEAGFPDLQIYIWSALLAPAATPAPIVTRLNAVFTKILRSDEIRSLWRDVDFEPLPTTPAEAAAFFAADSRRWAEAVRISGFKPTE